jgi:hypothetical protein
MASIKLTGDTSGEITISAPAVAGTNTLTLPAETGEILTTSNQSTNTPAFVVRKSINQNISDNVATKLTFDVEDLDTDSAFASNKFTVHSGKAGLYKFDAFVRLDGNNNSDAGTALLYLYKNGTAQGIFYSHFGANYPRAISMNISQILNLSVGDYIEIYAAMNTIDNSDVIVNSNKYTVFCGHKLIG